MWLNVKHSLLLVKHFGCVFKRGKSGAETVVGREMASRNLGGVLGALLLTCLFSQTTEFDLKGVNWNELSPDIASLQWLKEAQDLNRAPILRVAADARAYPSFDWMEGRGRHWLGRRTIPGLYNLEDFLHYLQKREPLNVVKYKQTLDNFLAEIDGQRHKGWLLSASDLSYTYTQKLLIMIDDHRSTNARVLKEYSMDPHYSMIVSKACLHNDSCLPEVDSNTVVKIFGTVSEDGRTVSDYSGSSLADLMLKPSLETAPVFSLDGNTTTVFQHDFIRVFMLRGIKAVLETSQGDQLMYQVMDKKDLVTKFQTEKRPADHTTQYDNQHILIMQDDPVVRGAAYFLYEKHPAVSSVYVLDENLKPKLIHGDSVPLSADSRLVLVGHGQKDNTGETKLSGYSAKDVSEIIGRTSRDGDQLKAISVVACDVGSDEAFMETLLKELHETAHIQTELHLRNTLLQVTHTGEKISLEITPTGLEWRHKDNSKKVVATLDQNGKIVVKDLPISRGEAVFTNERNFLVNEVIKERFQKYKDSWPLHPQRFIDREIFKDLDQNKAELLKNACDELEGLSWGLFHSDRPLPSKVDTNNLQDINKQYVIGNKEKSGEITWNMNEKELRDVLSECYEIKSGEDILNIIHHYAKTGENKQTYLMVNDWIYIVDPQNLYVYPVGKKLDNNQIVDNVKECIKEQVGKSDYDIIRENVVDNNNPKELYVEYVRDTFQGKHPTHPSLSREAWFNTYLTASIISESARNFRTFPLVLMALDMSQSPDNNIKEKGFSFFCEENPMARGATWIDPSRRGFSGSSTAEESSKLENKGRFRRTKKQLEKSLKRLIESEEKVFTSWSKNVDNNEIASHFYDIAKQNSVLKGDSNEKTTFQNDHNTFQEEIAKTPKPSGDKPSTSGILGGSDDGSVTVRDLHSASESEISLKLASYYSRASASYAEQIHSHMKAEFGENLAGLHVKEGSARLENGQFVCQLISDDVNVEPVDFKVELHLEGQQYNDKMLKSMEAAVHDLEIHGSETSHHGSEHVERAGTAVGTLGLMLGMKGAVRAFEEGDIKDGVTATLQTVHGVTGMTMAAIGKQALSSETKVAKAVLSFMESPVMKGTLKILPIVGIGFGIYNVEQDIERGDALGVVDAVLDSEMVVLDVIETVQPELAPFVAPVTLALSVVRMVIDDVYMGIQNELNSLPKDAGLLDKIQAVIVGFGKGLLHFAIHVASFFYDWHYEEIEEGRRLVAQISDFHKYYKVTKEEDGTSAIDFSGGDSSWNGGGISFCLADQGQSEFCMDYFVSDDESFGKTCWNIDTHESKDIILGLGESHQLEYKTLQKKVLMFIPAGTVTVVSGYKALSNSRYGTYKGNRESNRFFAVQKAEDKAVIEVMLSYYYQLYGEPGDDIFFLGPQMSYVEGSGGKDTYIIPDDGGKTIINNYDPFKSMDTLLFSVDYSQISVSKSGNDVVLRYLNSHTVTIQGWFQGEAYRHMNMMSGDGVLFEISSTVISSVQLVARGINKMSKDHGGTVDTSQPLLCTVTSILGSPYDDTLIGNGENNWMDGGGGQDRLIGGEGEDIYMVKDRKQSKVLIENYSTDNTTDIAIIEANLDAFKVRVEGDDLILNPFADDQVPPNDRSEMTRVNSFSPIKVEALIPSISNDHCLFCVYPDCDDTYCGSSSTSDDRSDVTLVNSFSPIKVEALIPSIINDHCLFCVYPDCDDTYCGSSSTSDDRSDVTLVNWFRSEADRHLLVITKDMVTFTVSDNKADCMQSDPFTKCIRSHSIDYSKSSSALEVDLEKDEALHSVTEVRGSEFNDVIKGNKGRNTIVPGRGSDFLQGRGGEDWYVVTPDQGLKTIDNQSPDLAMDTLFLKVDYEKIRCICHGLDMILNVVTYHPDPLTPRFLVEHRRNVVHLKGWFRSKYFQHLQIQTDNGITFELASNANSCYGPLKLPKKVDFRQRKTPQMITVNNRDFASVIEMYGSSSSDTMIGNNKNNLLDPYTGGGSMTGGEGRDTYVVKRGYGTNLMIDNFAQDGIVDAVLVDMDFLSGSQITLDSDNEDLVVRITAGGEDLQVRLINYSSGPKHQHLIFQTSDGVYFNVNNLNKTKGFLSPWIEAFKVTMKETQVDCHLDLNSQGNLSRVHTVQGCPSLSNHIQGNDQDNALIGGWKDDALEGGEGNDTLIGGKGNDFLIGGWGDDTLHGEDGDDTMMGDSGWDILIPGPGADLVDGGPGRDTVLYQGDHEKGEGVYVNLLTGEGHYADAEGDVLKDVENVIGTIYSDILVSGYEPALLKGSDGNDMLVSVGGDYLIGGDGNDIYMLAFPQGSVTIDNCAKDNAIDVLYLSSMSIGSYNHTHFSDGILLNFYGENDSAVHITLQNWLKFPLECRHLEIVLREGKYLWT